MGFAPAVPLPLIGNLVGLPHGWARGLGTLPASGAATYLDDFCSAITFTTSELVNPVGNILLYIIASEDGLHWTDGIDPKSSTSQDSLIGQSTQANLFQQLGGPSTGKPILPNTTYSFNNFSIKSVFNFTPTFWSPLVWNLLGGPLSLTISPIGFHTVQT